MFCLTELSADVTNVESFFRKNNTHRGIVFITHKNVKKNKNG